MADEEDAGAPVVPEQQIRVPSVPVESVFVNLVVNLPLDVKLNLKLKAICGRNRERSGPAKTPVAGPF